ncbi:MAG: hypothetical protein HRT88_21850, partial [Lentisphaeraceae bacterium]|nr:hypothetical protein [Lentisphaeraceae bacterium]
LYFIEEQAKIILVFSLSSLLKERRFFIDMAFTSDKAIIETGQGKMGPDN